MDASRARGVPAPFRTRVRRLLQWSLPCLAAVALGLSSQAPVPDGPVVPVRKAAADTEAIPGFAEGSLPAERALEERFLAVPSTDSVEAHVRWLSASPHFAGTEGARTTAAWLAAHVRALGFEVEIDRYDVWLPYPRRIQVGVTTRRSGVQRTEWLRTEAPVPPRDRRLIPDTSSFLLAWTAYSGAGRVSAPAVYVNRGLPRDYAALAKMGVDVHGRVVIARYGGAYRGVKAAQAEEHGAAALLLYPDPADDGFSVGDTVPIGPYRPAESIQRGTVAYLWQYTGDPLTPGHPSLPGVPRLPPSQASDLPDLPVVALAYGEAAKLLQRLDGPVVPRGWQGGLPFSYHVGPGPDTVCVDVALDTTTRTIEDVVARLHGRSSEEVILGGHYDAWLLGAADPHTGTSALLEIARSLSALRKTGWTPRRTLTLAFWDAEEPGDVGSTEWVEAHSKELSDRAVAYFNVDMLTAGSLVVQGSPALRDLVLSVARDVDDPLTGEPLLDAMRARQQAAWRRRPAATDTFRMTLGDIGAGSDWTAFLHWAGVPSLQWTMNGRGTYAVYHSALDDFDYYRQHVDSAFVSTPVFARAMGLAALRLVQADVPPFRYTLYADRIATALDALERENAAATGPHLELDLVATRRALARMRTAAVAVEAATPGLDVSGHTSLGWQPDGVALAAVERSFLDPAGLPGRPWYRHQITAPGRDTGYDAELLPAVADALAAADQVALSRGISQLDTALERAVEALERAAALAPRHTGA